MVRTERFKIFEKADCDKKDENNARPRGKKLFFVKEISLNTRNFFIFVNDALTSQKIISQIKSIHLRYI